MANFEGFGSLDGWPNHETKEVFEHMGADMSLHDYAEQKTVPTAQLARDLEKRFRDELDRDHRPASLAYQLMCCALERVQWFDIAQHMNAGREGDFMQEPCSACDEYTSQGAEACPVCGETIHYDEPLISI